MSAIEADPGSELIWRRRCLWGLLILLPAVIAEISYQPAMALLGSKDFMARDVASDEEVRFGGSDWRLDAMLTTSDTGRAKLPANAAPVFVDFSVRVGDPDLEKLWQGCRIRLVDRDQRSWSPSYVSILPPADDQTSLQLGRLFRRQNRRHAENPRDVRCSQKGAGERPGRPRHE